MPFLQFQPLSAKSTSFCNFCKFLKFQQFSANVCYFRNFCQFPQCPQISAISEHFLNFCYVHKFLQFLHISQFSAIFCKFMSIVSNLWAQTSSAAFQVVMATYQLVSFRGGVYMHAQFYPGFSNPLSHCFKPRHATFYINRLGCRPFMLLYMFWICLITPVCFSS